LIKLISENNITTSFVGSLKPNYEKRNYTSYIFGGVERESYVRVALNYDLTISYITEEEYNKLIYIFTNDNNSLSIIDEANNIYHSKLYIQGSGLSLEEKVNKIDGSKCYIGNLNLRRR